MKITEEQLNDKAEKSAPATGKLRPGARRDNWMLGYKAGYRAAESADKWVPTSEKLPDINIPVLVYMPGYRQKIRIMWLSAQLGETVWYDSTLTSRQINQVTHWQPLPAPPQTETGL